MIYKILLSISLSILTLNANTITQQTTKIYDATEDTAKIPIGSLSKGQSGIVVHRFKNGNSSIISSGFVIKSEKSFSIIEFSKSKILMQNALPSIKLSPANDDIFILNHLSKNNLLITPNYEASNLIQKLYPRNNFYNPDLFAAYLKIKEAGVPDVDLIKSFTSLNDIGNIYVYIKNRLYILDAITFKIVQTKDISLKSKKFLQPFYTNINSLEDESFDNIKNGVKKLFKGFSLNLYEDTKTMQAKARKKKTIIKEEVKEEEIINIPGLNMTRDGKNESLYDKFYFDLLNLKLPEVKVKK